MRFYMKQLRYLPTMKRRDVFFAGVHGREIMNWVNAFYRDGSDIMEMGDALRTKMPNVDTHTIYRIAFALDCLLKDIKMAKMQPISRKP